MKKEKFHQKSISSFFKPKPSSPEENLIENSDSFAKENIKNDLNLKTKRDNDFKTPSTPQVVSSAKKQKIIQTDEESNFCTPSNNNPAQITRMVPAYTPVKRAHLTSPMDDSVSETFTPFRSHPISMTPITGEERKKARKEAFLQKNESKYSFLDDIRDSQRRSPSDPDYDPTTLYISNSFWKECSPFEKQYWEIKVFSLLISVKKL
jgi:DNA mismatch repair protein MSH6